MKKVNVPLTIGTDGEDSWEPFMFASMGPTRKPVIAKIAEGGFEIYVVCDSPSAPIDLTAIERVFTNMEDAMFYADMLAEDERWQSLMDDNKRGHQPKEADMCVYNVYEDNHGVVSCWSSEELAKAECLAIVNSMYDGDIAAMDEGLVGYSRVDVDRESFVYGNGYGGKPEFEELMR